MLEQEILDELKSMHETLKRLLVLKETQMNAASNPPPGGLTTITIPPPSQEAIEQTVRHLESVTTETATQKVYCERCGTWNFRPHLHPSIP